jgi:hypothetical protein
LSTIGKLHLPPKRFPEGIIIPKAVWEEVVEAGSGRPGSVEVSSAKWISVQEAADKSLVNLLRTELDQGEAEAIALAHEVKAKVVLLDERDARSAAGKLGMRVLGTVGILIWSKRAGLIASLRNELNLLESKAKFRLSQQLHARALSEAGE